MAKFWIRMENRFGSRWRSQFGTADGAAFDEWTRALASFEPDNVVQGYYRVCESGMEWPPNLAQFEKYCRGDPSDYPSPSEAYRECGRKSHDPHGYTWSHAIVYATGKEFGWWELSHYANEKEQRRFEDLYREMIKRAERGELCDAPRLESKESGPAQEASFEERQEARSKAMAGMAIFGGTQ